MSANLSEFCIAAEIDLRMGDGRLRRIMAWRYGELAAHRTQLAVGAATSWSLTHLPSGLSFNRAHGIFPDKEHAIAAMVEIATLKNTWEFLETTELPALQPRIEAIARKHGGKLPTFGAMAIPISRGLNGYTPEGEAREAELKDEAMRTVGAARKRRR